VAAGGDEHVVGDFDRAAVRDGELAPIPAPQPEAELAADFQDGELVRADDELVALV
jgi:hypothetical protein